MTEQDLYISLGVSFINLVYNGFYLWREAVFHGKIYHFIFYFA